MPGDPPSNTSDDGIMPPPSILSNSFMPVVILGVPEIEILSSSRTSEENSVSRRLEDSGFITVDSSTKEFHSLQSGHLPSHFCELCPQFRQTKTAFAFCFFMA